MWHVVRLAMIFIFGNAMAKTIEESATGAFFMGAIALGLTVWMVLDIVKYTKGLL